MPLTTLLLLLAGSGAAPDASTDREEPVVIGSRAAGQVTVVGGERQEAPAEEDELVALRRRVAALEAAEAERAAAAGTGRLLDEIRLAIYGDVFGRTDSKRVVNEDGDEVDDRIRVRQVGLDLRAPLGEHASAVLYTALTSDPVNDFEADVEEGYVELVGVPLLGGLGEWTRLFRFKGGKFRSSFGASNRTRLYELPLVTRPLPVTRFLGDNGFSQSGYSIHFDVPLPEAHTLVLTYEGLDNGDLPVADTDGEEAFADLLDADYRLRLGAENELAAGISYYTGKQNGEQSLRSKLFGLDLLFSHRPADAERGAFWLGGERITARIDRASAPEDEPEGWYVWSQVQLHPSWYVGARFGTVEELDDASIETDRYGLYVTYAPSEALRFALGYEHSQSDLTNRDGADTVLFDVSFAIGPDREPPSWLRR